MSWQVWSQLSNGQQYQANQPNSRQKALFNLVMVFGLWIKKQLRVKAGVSKRRFYIQCHWCYMINQKMSDQISLHITSMMQWSKQFTFMIYFFSSVIICSLHWLLSMWLQHFNAARPLMYFSMCLYNNIVHQGIFLNYLKIKLLTQTAFLPPDAVCGYNNTRCRCVSACEAR